MSDHWYKQDGSPCYDQATAKGGTRSTDLRDARKLGLVPSVTTILQVAPKPQLEAWKVKQGILAALTLTREVDETDDAFLARVLKDSQEQAKLAAEEGNRIHDAIESHYKGRVVSPQYRPHVEAATAEIARLFPHVTDWRAEDYFAHPDGFGGKVDLHSPSTGIVVDYKGKDGDFTDGKKLAYDQHYQMAAYNKGLRLPVAPSANIFVSRTHPGKVASHVWTVEDMAEGWEFFCAALNLWRRWKKFDPRFVSAKVA